jgi:hypothetical protein
MIVSSLNMSSIQNLESTWKVNIFRNMPYLISLLKEVPAKSTLYLKQIETLMSPSGNYKKYREMIKTSEPPLVPFQGLWFLLKFTSIIKARNLFTRLYFH